MKDAKSKIQNWLLSICIFNFAFLILACGVPVLESAECSAARDAAKRFYSFHFGNDMRATADNLRQRRMHLTPEYQSRLAVMPEGGIDPFTLTDEFPQAFKIGECRTIGPERAELQIQLLWRNDQRSAQRDVNATMIKSGDQWLLDAVSDRK